MANKRKDSIKEIEQSISILDKMFKENALNDILYYRAIMKLAFDCTEHSLYDKAMVLLLKIPRSYYKDYLCDDMEKSEEFFEKCSTLLKRMKLSGYDVEQLKVNMNSAKA